MKEILDTAFGSPEAQDGFLTYKLPRGPMTHPGFVSVSRETWNVRTELPGQAMMKVTEGSDFDELISHLRGLRLLKI